MMNIPNVHFFHTAVPSFIAALCSRGPLKRLSSPAIKRKKLKIKEGGGWMAERKRGRGQRVTTCFIPITYHRYAEHSYSSEVDTMNLTLVGKKAGRWRRNSQWIWRFIKGNGQCHFHFPSSVRFGYDGLGLISTIWLLLERSEKWLGGWIWVGFKSVSISWDVKKRKKKVLIFSVTLMWSQWWVWPGLVSISVDSEFMLVPWQ